MKWILKSWMVVAVLMTGYTYSLSQVCTDCFANNCDYCPDAGSGDQIIDDEISSGGTGYINCYNSCRQVDYLGNGLLSTWYGAVTLWKGPGGSNSCICNSSAYTYFNGMYIGGEVHDMTTSYLAGFGEVGVNYRVVISTNLLGYTIFTTMFQETRFYYFGGACFAGC